MQGNPNPSDQNSQSNSRYESNESPDDAWFPPRLGPKPDVLVYEDARLQTLNDDTRHIRADKVLRVTLDITGQEGFP